MHKGMPTGRGPRPAARVGYHMENGLATTFARADCRDGPVLRFDDPTSAVEAWRWPCNMSLTAVISGRG